MEEYIVGKEFPHKEYCPHRMDACRIMPSGNLFNLVFSLTQLNRREIDLFKKGYFRYGVFVENDIPFFLIKFPETDESFDFSINAFGINADSRDNWLDTEANAMIMFLVRAETCVLEVARMIGLDLSVVRIIKDACRRQLASYRDAEHVSQSLDKIMQQYSTEVMIAKAFMKTFA